MEMALYGVFRDAGIEEEKAKAIAATIWKTQEQSIDLKQVATKADIELVRVEIEKIRLETRADIEKSKNDLIKWVIGSAVAIVGITLTAIRLMLSAG